MEIIDPRYRSLNFPPKSKRNWKRTPREERRNRSFNRETKKIFGCRAFIYISFWSKWLAFPEKLRTRIEIQGASSLKDTNSTRWNQLELRSLARNYTLKRHVSTVWWKVRDVEAEIHAKEYRIWYRIIVLVESLVWNFSSKIPNSFWKLLTANGTT